jgi:hypothetical protein
MDASKEEPVRVLARFMQGSQQQTKPQVVFGALFWQVEGASSKDWQAQESRS